MVTEPRGICHLLPHGMYLSRSPGLLLGRVLHPSVGKPPLTPSHHQDQHLAGAGHHLCCRWRCRQFGEKTEGFSLYRVAQSRGRQRSLQLSFLWKTDRRRQGCCLKINKSSPRWKDEPGTKSHRAPARCRLLSGQRPRSRQRCAGAANVVCWARQTFQRAASSPSQPRHRQNRSSPLGLPLPCSEPIRQLCSTTLVRYEQGERVGGGFVGLLWVGFFFSSP